MRDVANYHGVKFSLRPHGFRSKLFWCFAVFVVAFGGALAVMSPANAAPGDMSCFVETTPSPDPSATTTASPAPSFSPTPCPSTSTSITTLTVPGPVMTVTKAVTKTVTETVTMIATPSPSSALLTITVDTIPQPIPTATTVAVIKVGKGGSSLVDWGLGVAGVAGVILLLIAAVGIIRGRRQAGRHRVDNDETQMMPVVSGGSVRTILPGDYDLSDYGPDADFDPSLGGHAGETYKDNTEQIS